MAVKIRMMRLGRRHRPFFRINAVDSRTPRDGRILEKLGHYDPIEKDASKQVVINLERVQHWLDLGAIPTDSVSDILLRHGLKTKHGQEKAIRREKAKSIARAKGKLFNKAEKIAAAKATDTEAAAKTAEEEAAKAAKEAAAKAAEEAAAAKAAEAKAAEEAAAAKAAESKATEDAAADKGDEEAKDEG